MEVAADETKKTELEQEIVELTELNEVSERECERVNERA